MPRLFTTLYSSQAHCGTSQLSRHVAARRGTCGTSRHVAAHCGPLLLSFCHVRSVLFIVSAPFVSARFIARFVFARFMRARLVSALIGPQVVRVVARCLIIMNHRSLHKELLSRRPHTMLLGRVRCCRGCIHCDNLRIEMYRHIEQCRRAYTLHIPLRRTSDTASTLVMSHVWLAHHGKFDSCEDHPCLRVASAF